MTVFMFHSLGLEKSDWVTNYLSIPVSHFEEWLRFLAKKKYNTVLLGTWYENHQSTFIKDDKKIVITFDDGYLDNWVYLFPLLQRYQIRATLFICPEFVDPGNEIRPSLSDVWKGRIKESELCAKGFLNWNEIVIMQQSGLVDIQSHSMSHNWYFTNNSLIDVYNARKYKDYYWINWFLKPELKPYYMINDHSTIIPEGYPVFTFGRSLGIRRYFPSQEYVELISNHGTTLNNFDEKISDKQKQLIFNKNFYGDIESDLQMIQRYNYELQNSKAIIEQKLQKKVEFLCWPGGAYNPVSIALSEIAGYKASTIATWERNKKLDNRGDYKRIQRFSLGTNINFKGKSVIDNNPYSLRNNFQEFEGNRIKMIKRYVKKSFYIVFK